MQPSFGKRAFTVNYANDFKAYFSILDSSAEIKPSTRDDESKFNKTIAAEKQFKI